MTVSKKPDWTLSACDNCEHFSKPSYCWHPKISNEGTKNKLIPEGEKGWVIPIPDWCPLEDAE